MLSMRHLPIRKTIRNGNEERLPQDLSPDEIERNRRRTQPEWPETGGRKGMSIPPSGVPVDKKRSLPQ